MGCIAGKGGWPPGTESNPWTTARKRVGTSVQQPTNNLSDPGEGHLPAPTGEGSLANSMNVRHRSKNLMNGFLTHTTVRQYILAVLSTACGIGAPGVYEGLIPAPPPLQIPRSTDRQAPFIKWFGVCIGPTHMSLCAYELL